MDTEQKFRPLKRAGDILMFACSAAAFLLVSVLSVGKIGSGAYSWQAGFGGAVSGVIGFFFVLNTRKCGDELFSFREYLKRNVRGYYKVFTWTQIYDGSRPPRIVRNNPLYVESRKLRAVLAMERSSQLIVAIPLGGWFAKPKMVCGWTLGRKWDIRAYPSGTSKYPRALEFSRFYLIDEEGSRIVVRELAEIAWLVGLFSISQLGDVTRHLSALHDRLEVSESKLGGTLTILRQAIREIEGTKRFQHSKEGARIREWLTRELVGLLPESDPRKAELRARVKLVSL